jgi:hypothetical protein
VTSSEVKKASNKNSKGKVDVSIRTLQRGAISGYKPLSYTKAVKKPLLTRKHHERRLDFCYKFKDLNWKRVKFTYSKIFNYTY